MPSPTSPEQAPTSFVALTTPRILLGIFAAAGFWVLYRNLELMAKWLTYELIGLGHGSPLAAAVEFFGFEVPKILMLLSLVVFAVGIVRTFFTPERTRRILVGAPVQPSSSLVFTLPIEV